MNDNNSTYEPQRSAISTPTQAEGLFSHLSDVMESLLRIVEEETNLVRAGRIGEMSRIEPLKADLAQLYIGDIERLKAATPYLKAHQPKLLQALRQRHDTFHALLQVNLTVLATARAVAESILRGVSQELTRKAEPQAYGAKGQQHNAPARRAQPLVMSRTL